MARAGLVVVERAADVFLTPTPLGWRCIRSERVPIIECDLKALLSFTKCLAGCDAAAVEPFDKGPRANAVQIVPRSVVELDGPTVLVLPTLQPKDGQHADAGRPVAVPG